MSLITIPEAYDLKCGIEVEGFVKCMSKPVWTFIDDLQDYKKVCNAKLTDGKGNMINIVFWENDISKVRNNLKIRITDAKWNISKKVLHKTKIGKIIVFGFNPNLIFDDVINLKKRNKINSFKKYYDYIQHDPSNYYLGADKKVYLNIARALWTIEKENSKFRNKKMSFAIKYLHNTITLSSEQIHSILGIFEIFVLCERILRISNKRKINNLSKIKPETSFSISIKDDDPDAIQLETICEELPSEISIDEAPKGNTKKSLSDTVLDCYRKYRGYYNHCY